MTLTKVAQDFKNVKKRGWQRNWEPFMRKYQCDYICELGVFKGDNFLEMVRHEPKMAVAVDTWNNDGVHSKRDASYSLEELDSQFEDFKKATGNLPFVQIIREDTAKAAKHFPDIFFDFVYVDADHSAPVCYSDLITWYPKVKQNKFLVGHDYRRGFGVVEAVNRFIKENKLELILIPPSTWAVIKK